MRGPNQEIVEPFGAKKIAIAIAAVIGFFAAEGYAAQAPLSPANQQTHGGGHLSINVTNPTLEDCRFRLVAGITPPVIPQPFYVWTLPNGTGSFNIVTPKREEGSTAFLTTEDFGVNPVHLAETVTGLNLDRPVQLTECKVAIRPEGPVLLLANEALNLTPRTCPDAGGAISWTVKNSAGTAIPMTSTPDFRFVTKIINTWQVDVKYSLLGKTCIAPTKSITVGQLDNLTWVDRSDVNNPLDNNTVLQGKKGLLVFTAAFSPTTAFTKDRVTFSYEVVGGIPGVLVSVAEDVAAGGSSSKVFRAAIDNQTGELQSIIFKGMLRDEVQIRTPTIVVGAF